MIELRELFKIQNGNGLALIHMQKGGDTPFIARGQNNNGIVDFVEKYGDISPFKPHKITVALGGSVMESFYQDREFYTSYHIKVLTPKTKMTKNQMLYYCMILRANKYRYSFGRQANKTLDYIKVPSLDEIPDYVNNTHVKKPSAKSLSNNNITLDSIKWKDFLYSEIFTISGTETTPMDDLLEYGKGRSPYVTTQAINNGVNGFFKYHTEKGNVLCIDSAVLGYCSYQNKKFSASDHVEKLELIERSLNKYIAVFLMTLINMEQYRYNYGRKRSQTKLKTEKIKLPVDKKGNPDWQFMEDYIKSLPYSSNL